MSAMFRMVFLGRREFWILGYFVSFGLIVGTGLASPEAVVLCDFMEETCKSIKKDLSGSFPNWTVDCLVGGIKCNTLNLSITYLGSDRKSGFTINFCETPPSIYFWKGSFWSHRFKVADKPQKVEIIHQENVAVTEGFPDDSKKWFLTTELKRLHKPDLLALKASLDICDQSSNSQEACSSNQFINTTVFSIKQICDGQFKVGGFQDAHQPLRLVADTAPALRFDQLHINENPTNSGSSHIGEECGISNPFFCGRGSTCKQTREGQGICECFSGFEKDPNGDGCVEKKPEPIKPTDDARDSTDSSSAGVGAVISVIILISLAGFLFIGTKYHIFSRLRNRLHYVRCWPFGRSGVQIDHVNMVNPVSIDDDDPPLM